MRAGVPRRPDGTRRVKRAYQRAGVDVITVPSHARRIPQTTGLVIREITAFWVYYLRAIL